MDFVHFERGDNSSVQVATFIPVEERKLQIEYRISGNIGGH